MNRPAFSPQTTSLFWDRWFLLLALLPFCSFLMPVSPAEAQEAEGGSVVRIVSSGEGFQLLRNGDPYFIKGMGGRSKWAEFLAAGGNSVRTWGADNLEDFLDEAQGRGLTVTVGIWLQHERHGFDYSDPEQVQRQLESARSAVREYKNHPALLMWGLGNEMENSAKDRVLVWQAIEEIAQMVKEEDGNHPVMTVIAEIGGDKLREISEHCPTLDAVGINTYAGMGSIPERMKEQGWNKPYLVTEFGPFGHWEVPQTSWGVPIEQTSTEKAGFYLRNYEHAVSTQPLCLGSYVFLWGNKQERTHTWYGMFLWDDSPLGAVDVMTYSWSGKWPQNRCPYLTSRGIWLAPTEESPGLSLDSLPAGAVITFQTEAIDAEWDPLEYQWELRPDATNVDAHGGEYEDPTAPMADSVVASEGTRVRIRMPETGGNYRVFVYVRDEEGRAAAANLPIRVVAKQ